MQKLWLVQVGFTAERVVGKAQAPNLETVKKKHESRSPVKFNQANTVFHCIEATPRLFYYYAKLDLNSGQMICKIEQNPAQFESS